MLAVTAKEGAPGLDASRSMWALLMLLSVLPLASLAAALFGNWRPARLLALPSVTVVPAAAVLGYWAATGAVPPFSVLAAVSAFSVPGVLWSLAVPAAPADLLGRVSRLGRSAMLAGLLFGFVGSGVQGLTRIGSAGGPASAPVLVLGLGLAVMAFLGARRGQVAPLALLLAVLPSGLGIVAGELAGNLRASLALLPVVLVVGVGVAVALRSTRERSPAGPEAALPSVE